VGRAVDENYGHAGPAFVARLRELLAARSGRADLIRRHRDLTDKLRGTTDLSGRRAPLVATVALTAELTSKWGITPGLTMPKPEVWLSLFAAEDATDNRPEMALDAAMEWIASNNFALWYPNCIRREPNGGWIGRTIQVGDKTTVATGVY
jgi:hypothetical protein